MRYGLSILGLLGLFLAMPLWAQADDARLRVVVAHENAGVSQPDAALAVRLALPVLWDRIVPLRMRARTNAIAPDYGLVARIIPGERQTTVEFNGQSIFRVLRERRIPAIIMAPRFHLVVQVRSSDGLAMEQTRTLLMEEAVRIASERGIELGANAPGLVAVWQWLDNRRVMFTLRGNTRLREFSETRNITDADPLPALETWLKDILLRTRDAYAFSANEPVAMNAGIASGQQMFLTVNRPARLLEQVTLEQALKNDPRVRSIRPLSLSKSRQRYLLQLEGTDSTWLPDWFGRHGYQLAALPGGEWLAQ